MINLKRLKILTFFLKHPIIRTYKTVHIYQIPIIIIEKLEKYEIQKGREKIMEITGKTTLDRTHRKSGSAQHLPPDATMKHFVSWDWIMSIWHLILPAVIWVPQYAVSEISVQKAST